MIKKLMLFVFLLSYTINSYGDFIDVNTSTLSIKGNQVNITSYINTLEIDHLLKINNKVNETVEDYYTNSDIIKKFISTNVLLENNNIKCNIINFQIYEEEIENIFTDGFKISYEFLCDSNITNLKLELNTFNLFPNQKYSFQIYNLNNGNKKILYKVLNRNENYIKIYNLKNYKAKKKTDSDCDGLSDEDEKIYNTNPNNPDTDGDYYTDNEEIKNNHEPLNKILGPGQEYREKLIKLKCINNELLIQKQDDNKVNNPKGFLNYYNKIKEYINKLLN